jgi:hypothetical protein
MPKWRLTSLLVVGWTGGLALLAAVALINPDLRHLDMIAGAFAFTQLWLLGIAPLAMLWVVAYLRRGGRVRL